jgi:hypothetical protein
VPAHFVPSSRTRGFAGVDVSDFTVLIAAGFAPFSAGPIIGFGRWLCCWAEPSSVSATATDTSQT